jgi:hypothetical protein
MPESLRDNARMRSTLEEEGGASVPKIVDSDAR